MYLDLHVCHLLDENLYLTQQISGNFGHHYLDTCATSEVSGEYIWVNTYR